MNPEALHNRQEKLREAAILIDSLDEQLAEQLVASMPAGDAAAVRRAVRHLGEVAPEERSLIVNKFRQSSEPQPQVAPPKTDGVELDESLLARFEDHSDEEQTNYEADSIASPSPLPISSLDSEETVTIVQMLSAEHPQTISVVLSRLNPPDAANLLSNFSPNLQADILSRMANCNTADEQAVRVIESQLGQWIDQQRQQRKRMAAGLDLVQNIFSSTSEPQQKTVLTQLRGSNPALAGQLDSKPAQQPETNEQSNKDSSAAINRVGKLLNLETSDGSAFRQEAQIPVRNQTENVDSIPWNSYRTNTRPAMAARPGEELDRLDDATLLTALSQSDRKVVTLALAGASESLMKRVLRGLPRRHASRLKSQLRDIGPTRLSDMFAAQQVLLNSAHQITMNK